MKRLLLLATVVGGAALALPAGASAAVGDIDSFEIEAVTLSAEGEELVIEGAVACAEGTGWGLISKAVQRQAAGVPLPAQGGEDHQSLGEDDADFAAEALGFGGPGSGNQGPVEQPCESGDGTEFDLVAETLDGSAPFAAGPIAVYALVATSPTGEEDPALLGDAEVFEGELLAEE